MLVCGQGEFLGGFYNDGSAGKGAENVAFARCGCIKRQVWIEQHSLFECLQGKAFLNVFSTASKTTATNLVSEDQDQSGEGFSKKKRRLAASLFLKNR
jgi:hypothetical protein